MRGADDPGARLLSPVSAKCLLTSHLFWFWLLWNAAHVVLTTFFFSFPPAQHPLGARDQEYINFPRLELSLSILPIIWSPILATFLILSSISTAVITNTAACQYILHPANIYMTQTTGYYILHTANTNIPHTSIRQYIPHTANIHIAHLNRSILMARRPSNNTVQQSTQQGPFFFFFFFLRGMSRPSEALIDPSLANPMDFMRGIPSDAALSGLPSTLL